MNLLTLITATLPLPEVSFAAVDNQEHFAVVYYHNQVTSGTLSEETIVVETAYGPVTFLLTRRGNAEDEPGDTLEAIDWPQSVIVRPTRLDLDENTRGEIRLYLWSGI